MLEPDNHILYSYSLYSFYTLPAVINSATGKSADSAKGWASLRAYLSLYLGWCVSMWLQSRRNIALSKGLNNRFALSLFIKDILLPSFSFLCPSAETLSVCLNEKSADSQLNAAALQFLCTVLTEETKNRSVEIPTSNCKPAPALCDIVRGPSAGQLFGLLLQVCRTYLNCFHPFVLWNKHEHFLSSHQSFEKVTFQDSLKKLATRALMTLLACSPTAQTYAAKGISPKNVSEDPKDKRAISLIYFRFPSRFYRELRGAVEAEPLKAQPGVGPTRQSSSSEKGQ